jgi:hypothetical protein
MGVKDRGNVVCSFWPAAEHRCLAAPFREESASNASQSSLGVLNGEVDDEV